MNCLKISFEYDESRTKLNAKRLLEFGISRIQLDSGIPAQSTCFSKELFCSGSSLHRGCMHPSPVADLIIGNMKRGKLLTVPPQKGDIVHRYLYNVDGKLSCIENYYMGKLAFTENLYYTQTDVIGVTTDCYGKLAAVSKEIYESERIVAFGLINCIHNGVEYECFNIREEFFSYDEIGLCESIFRNVSPQSGYVINKWYRFLREGGYLVAYSDIATPDLDEKQRVYKIKKRRKA